MDPDQNPGVRESHALVSWVVSGIIGAVQREIESQGKDRPEDIAFAKVARYAMESMSLAVQDVSEETWNKVITAGIQELERRAQPTN